MNLIHVLGLMRNLHKTILFNFRYLPLRQAIKLPIIFVSKVKFINLKGKVAYSGGYPFSISGDIRSVPS